VCDRPETRGTAVTCYLLHIMEDPDREAYRDQDLKDIVGLMPRFFCAQCQPLKMLVASNAVKCMRRNAPCWKPPGTICDDDAQASGPAPGSGDSSPYTF
jgi:hypothetical protein